MSSPAPPALESSSPTIPKPARPRLSLSALIPQSKFLRRLSSPTMNSRRSSETDTRDVRETAPSPSSAAPRRSSAFETTSLARQVTARSDRAEHAIVEEPELIEYCTETGKKEGGPFDDEAGGEDQEAYGYIKRSASESDTSLQTSAIPKSICQRLDTAPPYIALNQTRGHSQSAPTTPMRSQQVWLCSAPKRTLTPVSPTSPFSVCAKAQALEQTHRPPPPTSPLSPFSSPLDNIAAAAQHAKEQIRAAEAQAQAKAAAAEQFEIGPPKRCRPVTTRAMSTGRLASEFDEDGRVICLSVHSDRVLAKGHKSPLEPCLEGGRRSSGPKSWKVGGTEDLSRSTSEQGAATSAVGVAKPRFSRAARSSIDSSGPRKSAGLYNAGEGAKRSRASLKGMLGF